MTLTTESLAGYLGRPAASILADPPFCDWPFDRLSETDPDDPQISYVFSENGLDLLCDEDERVSTIFLYSDGDRHFAEGVSDLPISWTRKKILERLGSPSESGSQAYDPVFGECGAWDRFARIGYTIHILYRLNADCIGMITLMRPDVVP